MDATDGKLGRRLGMSQSRDGRTLEVYWEVGDWTQDEHKMDGNRQAGKLKDVMI